MDEERPVKTAETFVTIDGTLWAVAGDTPTGATA